MEKKLRELNYSDIVSDENNDGFITIKGAKEHNLKNVSLKIPKNKLVVFTGVSGSGKSTIVFDVIHKEAQRRFMKGFSTFVQNSIGNVQKPNVSYISGLNPTIALKQKGANTNPRSTVGTITEITDYMRLLYSRIGIRYCTNCNTQIEPLLYKNSINKCPECGEEIKFLSSQYFSFNTPLGMCPKCRGLGVTQEADLEKIIGDQNLSVLDGAVLWYGYIGKENKEKWVWPTGRLDILFNHYGVSIETPWKDLPEYLKSIILYGTDEKINYPIINNPGKMVPKPVKGIVTELTRLYFNTASEHTRKKYASYMKFKTCSMCNGAKLNQDALHVKIKGYNIAQISSMPVEKVLNIIKNLYETADENIFKISKDIIIEIYKRLSFLNDSGLSYLSLDRKAPTLSGGECQRVRLASQLSSEITGVTYVLDEPSAGLHMRDIDKLVSTLKKLRDAGNTILVVEHHERMIKEADYIVDIGPLAGRFGGQIMSCGTEKEIEKDKNSLTGMYLSGKMTVDEEKKETALDQNLKYLTLEGACHNNLKDITVHFPLNKITCVTGVSGSGKSSLISETLMPLLQKLLNGQENEVSDYKKISGYEDFDSIIDVSQKPIGKTPRSNPATYIGLFDKIRKLFSKTEDAKKRKMTSEYFSFNSAKGRCPYCEGQGEIKIEMHFMPDVWVKCEKCDGKRFKDEVLDVKIDGKNISDVLNMDVSEALEFFKDYKDIHEILKVMNDVGLSYIKLGQSATTLSGGEAQRVKLAKELSKKSSGNTLYILDEPTTGLHFNDIKKLIKILKMLIKEGNTIIIIEHNTDIINASDYIIDIGPEGGERGGYVVAEGSRKEVSKCKESYTSKYINI